MDGGSKIVSGGGQGRIEERSGIEKREFVEEESSSSSSEVKEYSTSTGEEATVTLVKTTRAIVRSLVSLHFSTKFRNKYYCVSSIITDMLYCDVMRYRLIQEVIQSVSFLVFMFLFLLLCRLRLRLRLPVPFLQRVLQLKQVVVVVAVVK